MLTIYLSTLQSAWRYSTSPSLLSKPLFPDPDVVQLQKELQNSMESSLMDKAGYCFYECVGFIDERQMMARIHFQPPLGTSI